MPGQSQVRTFPIEYEIQEKTDLIVLGYTGGPLTLHRHYDVILRAESDENILDHIIQLQFLYRFYLRPDDLCEHRRGDIHIQKSIATQFTESYSAAVIDEGNTDRALDRHSVTKGIIQIHTCSGTSLSLRPNPETGRYHE